MSEKDEKGENIYGAYTQTDSVSMYCINVCVYVCVFVCTWVLSDLWRCKMSVRQEHDKVNNACGKETRREKGEGDKSGRKESQ